MLNKRGALSSVFDNRQTCLFASYYNIQPIDFYSFHLVQYFAGSTGCSDAQFSVQHLFRKLGNDEFIGQRVILAVSQKISNVSERLLLVDPFDDAFPDMHDNIFIM